MGECLIGKEGVLPQSLFAVSADDKFECRRALAKTVATLNPKYRVKTVMNFTELIEQALVGNDGKQADVVFLDQEFIMDSANWRLDQAALAEQNDQYRGIHISDRILKGSGTSFAAVLRSLGFAGRIFLVTSEPPEPDAIERVAEVFRALGITIDGFPVSGVVLKPNRYVNCWSKEFRSTDSGQPRKWQIQIHDGTFADSIRALLAEPPVS